MLLKLSSFVTSCPSADVSAAVEAGEIFLWTDHGSPIKLVVHGAAIPIVLVTMEDLDKTDNDFIDMLKGLTRLHREVAPLSIVFTAVDGGVIGVILPVDMIDLELTLARSETSETDLGSSAGIPASFGTTVVAAIYACPFYPAHPGYAAYSIGVSIPHCPICGQERTKVPSRK